MKPSSQLAPRFQTTLILASARIVCKVLVEVTCQPHPHKAATQPSKRSLQFTFALAEMHPPAQRQTQHCAVCAPPPFSAQPCLCAPDPPIMCLFLILLLCCVLMSLAPFFLSLLPLSQPSGFYSRASDARTALPQGRGSL